MGQGGRGRICQCRERAGGQDHGGAEVGKWPRVWAQQVGGGVGRSQEVKLWAGGGGGAGVSGALVHGGGGAALGTPAVPPPAGPELSGRLLQPAAPTACSRPALGPVQTSERGSPGAEARADRWEVPRCVRRGLRTTAGSSGAQGSARAKELGSRWPGPTWVTWMGPSPAPLPRVQLTRTLLSQGPNSEKQHRPRAARAAVHTQGEGTDGGGLGPSDQGQHLAGKRRPGRG